MIRLAVALLVVSAGAAAAAPPPPRAPIPHEPARLARALAENDAALRGAIHRWVTRGNPARGGPPADVTLYALYQQRMYRLLAREAALERAVRRRLPARVASHVRDSVAARRALFPLATPQPRRAFRTQRPEPAGRLLAHYRKAERRFGVGWHVLAAVNFVESAFGKLRNASSAGAQGPMQFMPATWRAYGLGGDVHDPHDAILGAANYLRASGAPRNYPRALFAYNHSWAYVEAVLRYARQIRRDRRAFYAYYSWQVYALTTEGIRRITGPGLR